MKSLWGEKYARANTQANDSRFRMCGRCRRSILPKGVGSTLRADVLRAPAKGMIKPDARADRIKRRKDAKALRRVARTEGIVAAAKFFLTTPIVTAPSEECEDCLKLRSRTGHRTVSAA